jgi:thioredoxin:protein disulfide reductase
MQRICAGIAVSAVMMFGVVSAGSHGVPQTEEMPIVVVEPFLSADGVPAGGTIKLAVRARIIPGWHINGPVQDDPFIIPTVLSCVETEDLILIETVYPQARIARFGYADGEIAVYDGDVHFGLLLSVPEAAAPGSRTIKGRLSFQGCDDQTCLPPKSEPFEIELNVVPAGTETTELNEEIFATIEFRNK